MILADTSAWVEFLPAAVSDENVGPRGLALLHTDTDFDTLARYTALEIA